MEPHRLDRPSPTIFSAPLWDNQELEELRIPRRASIQTTIFYFILFLAMLFSPSSSQGVLQQEQLMGWKKPGSWEREVPIRAAQGRDWRLKAQQTGKTTSQRTRPPRTSKALPHERLENNQFLPSSHLKKNGKQRHRKDQGESQGLQHPWGQTSKGKIKISKYFYLLDFFSLPACWMRARAQGFHRTSRNSWSRGKLENSHPNGAATGRGTHLGPGKPKAPVCH